MTGQHSAASEHEPEKQQLTEAESAPEPHKQARAGASETATPVSDMTVQSAPAAAQLAPESQTAQPVNPSKHMQEQPESPDLCAALTSFVLLATLVIGLVVSLRLWRMQTSLTELGTYIQVIYPVLVSATLTSTAGHYARAFLAWLRVPTARYSVFQLGGALLLFMIALLLLLSMPWQAQNLNNIGVQARERGATFQALAAFQQASAYDPENASLFYNLGNVYEDLNRPDDAILAYERTLELTATRTTQLASHSLPTTWFAATNNLARLLILSGDTVNQHRALEMLSAAIHADPPLEVQAALYRNLALNQIELQLYHEAQDSLLYTQKLEPESHSSACVAALFHESTHNPVAQRSAAQAAWQSCLGATPDEKVPVHWLAIARERLRASP